MSTRNSRLVLAIAGLAALVLADTTHGDQRRHNRIVDLLAQNKVVFGWFSPARTAEAAERAAKDELMDFVFLNMEQPRTGTIRVGRAAAGRSAS